MEAMEFGSLKIPRVRVLSFEFESFGIQFLSFGTPKSVRFPAFSLGLSAFWDGISGLWVWITQTARFPVFPKILMHFRMGISGAGNVKNSKRVQKEETMDSPASVNQHLP